MDPNRLDIHPVMVGTAGHIDHGKSSLVRSLTGIDPDRLKEEKERGLTIDLGFAPLRLADGRTMGMIDVPGHERFVRNMVAGSTSLDLAILVVAADDGVMPQTVEHLDILDLLGVKLGVVALTKVDMVDEEMAALAEEDVIEHLRGTALAGSRIVRVSNLTGQGFDALRQELERLAAAITPRSRHGPFRMPIQRVFTLHGIGTVITGVPVSGEVTAGTLVELLPGGAQAKVRAVQAFGGKVERAVAGHSTALSVPDAREAGLHRGMVAATPGIFRVGDAIDVELRLLARTRPLEHRRAVRFHTGTIEAQGELLLLDRDAIGGGETLVARIELEQQVCCAPEDRFLLRLQNPPVTVGGGRVLRVLDVPGRYRRNAVGQELERLVAAGSKLDARVLEELTIAGPAGLTAGELATRLAVDAAAAEEVLAGHAEIVVPARGGRAFLRRVLDDGIAELLGSVQRMLKDRPLAASVKRAALRPSRTLPQELQDAVLDHLQRQGQVRTGTHGRVLFMDRLKPLPAAEQQRLRALVELCEQAGFRPPARTELAAALGTAPALVDGLLARAIDEGLVEEVGEHVYASATVQRALLAIRRNCLRHAEVLEIPELRDELGTSRKFLIPLLEHVDGLGLTRLRGGVRVLLPSSPVARELAAVDKG